MQKASFRSVDGTPLVLTGARAEGRVVGRMLDMHITQTFENREDCNIEAVYTFPLPFHAVLLGIEVQLNGETLVGVVSAKAQARNRYEDALSEGHTGVMVSVNHDGSYTLELGNMMAGESCLVRLKYAQVLESNQGNLRLTVPTTIAPRYGDPVRHAHHQPHSVPAVSSTVEYPFHISMTVMGELQRAQIGSPTHPIAIRTLPRMKGSESDITVISLASVAWLDRDFVLQFDGLATASQGLAAWDVLKETEGVLMASFTPKFASLEGQAKPVAMKVLVDCSSSMNGDSMQAARRALQNVLTRLQKGDRFSLSRFGSDVEHRSKAMWKVTPAAMAAARKWVELLEADLGGTEMEEAIGSTLALPGADKANVLLVTDGEIYAIDSVLSEARNSGQRFFVVGIGASATEPLLRRLAEATGGACEFVTPGEHVEAAILRLFNRMRSPVVTSARVIWPGQAEALDASDLPINIYSGDDITIYGRLRGTNSESFSSSMKLVGHIDDAQELVCLAELVPNFIEDHDNTLARLAVNHRYWQIERNSLDKDSPIVSSLPELAEEYQLVTADTSLALVKERNAEDRAQDMPELRTVAGMLAAGWGGSGSVLSRGFRAAVDDQVMLSLQLEDIHECMSVPSVWRTYRRPAVKTVDDQSRGGMDDFEIPAFLRKGADVSVFEPAARASTSGWQPSPREKTFWSQDGGEVSENGRSLSLTPAGLLEGLRRNPEGVWPQTYRELSAIGVGLRVVEWLELVIGEAQHEREVVQAFLHVVSQLEIGALRGLLGAPRSYFASSASLTSEQQKLRRLINEALASLQDETWPSSVLEFVEKDQGL